MVVIHYGHVQRTLYLGLNDLECGRHRVLVLWQEADFTVCHVGGRGDVRGVMAHHERAGDVVGMPGANGGRVFSGARWQLGRKRTVFY